MPIPKWLPTAAFLFVLFLIYQEPSSAGDTAGNFAGFVVELLSAVGEFLTGLFDGTSETVGNTGADASPEPSVAPSTEGVEDTFTHTHDGITHSHTGTEN
jgi:hypothetical protein